MTFRSTMSRESLAILALYLIAPTLQAGENDKPAKPGEVREFEIAAGVSMKFCWVPVGTVQLGAAGDEQDYLTIRFYVGERPGWMDTESASHCGKFDCKGFWMAKYPVTQREWHGVMGNQPSWFSGDGGGKVKVAGVGTGRFPVEQVSWAKSGTFVSTLNERAGVEKIFGRRGKFALPHENEWEYACRGGKGNAMPFYFGAGLSGKQANCDTRRYPSYGEEGEKYVNTLARLRERMRPGIEQATELPLQSWLEQFRQNLEGTTMYIRINEESLGADPPIRARGDDAPRIRIGAMAGASVHQVMTAVLGQLDLTYVVHTDHLELIRLKDVYRMSDRSPIYLPAANPSEVYKKAVAVLKAPMKPGVEMSTEVPLAYWLDNYFRKSLAGTGIQLRVNTESLRRAPAVDPASQRINIQALAGATLEAVMVEVLWKQALTFAVHDDHIEILKRSDVDRQFGKREFLGIAVGRTTEVGAYEKAAPHPWGLCDMHGNVWQWCEDWRDDRKTARVLRGGSWNSSAADCRAARRGSAPPDRTANDIGFRVCFRPE